MKDYQKGILSSRDQKEQFPSHICSSEFSAGQTQAQQQDFTVRLNSLTLLPGKQTCRLA
jgi:hypothetical protein